MLRAAIRLIDGRALTSCDDARRYNGSSDSFMQVNEDGIAFLFADAFSKIRFDGQLVGAVSESSPFDFS
jgi:hypothetical protein